MPKTAIIILFYYFLYLPSVTAQGSFSDTAFRSPGRQYALELYFKTVGENAHLYNGSEYVSYGQNILSHPFFKSDSLQKGTIYYDGILYHDIPMWYDLVSDQIIIKDYTQNYYICLVNEKIRHFFLLNHAFIQVEEDSTGSSVLERGFYDQMYTGKVSFLVKRKKQIRSSTSVDKVTSQFVQFNIYYIQKDNTYFRIGNKATLLRAFKDRKNEIRKYYREKKLQFKSDPENTILKMVEYYDQLKN